jgi:hypothetical protein
VDIHSDNHANYNKYIYIQGPAGRCEVFGMVIKVGVGGLAHAQWLAVTRC